MSAAPRQMIRMPLPLSPTPRFLSLATVLIVLATLASCAVTRPRTAASTYALQLVPPVDVLTQHGDRARTGSNVSEIELRPDNVASPRFQRLFEWEVDGQIYSQPLYVSQVVADKGTINLVIVATMHNSVYAFEAPPAGSTDRPSKDPLWHVGPDVLGPALPHNFFGMNWAIFLGYNIKPEIGIVATPVIDRQQGLVYVTTKSGSAGIFGIGRKVRHQLFAIDLLTGAIKNHTDINLQVADPNAVTAKFDAMHQMQRAGLLEANGQIYLSFASHQDSTPYHGWVFAYDPKTLKQTHSYCTTCGRPKADSCDDHASCEGGIWQAGGGPALDSDGNLYVMTGNGSFNDTAGDRATSFIKLDPQLHFMGSWTPINYDCLSRTDSDLGSAGPLIMSWKHDKTTSDLLIGGGKEGLLYAIRADTLHGTQMGEGAAQPLGQDPDDPCAYIKSTVENVGANRTYWAIQAAPLWYGDDVMDPFRLIFPSGLAQGFHHIHGAPVLWNVNDGTGATRPLVYISAERDLLRAYEFKQGFPGTSVPGKPPTALYESRCPNSNRGMPGGFLTLSANGDDANTGIVWAAMPRRNSDALTHVVPGVLRAYRAYPDDSGKLVELWNSDQGPNPPSDTDCTDSFAAADDELGLFAKFVPPTVSEGKVYMATFSNRLVVYGLKPLATSTQRTARTQGYNAQLSTGQLPTALKPDDVVAISIVAQNNGSTTWRAGGQVQLASRFIPNLSDQVVEGLRALQLPTDIPQWQSYTFNFHLHIPSQEGIYYYKWQMSETAGEAEQKSEGWFGTPTPEWRFSVLRPDCDDLRQRAAAATAAIPHPTTNIKLPDDQVQTINALRTESEQRGCRLTSANMDMPADAGGTP